MVIIKYHDGKRIPIHIFISFCVFCIYFLFISSIKDHIVSVYEISVTVMPRPITRYYTKITIEKIFLNY